MGEGGAEAKGDKGESLDPSGLSSKEKRAAPLTARDMCRKAV